MVKLFVWDFHGVLETGNENAVLEISNSVLGKEGYSERFTAEDIEILYGRKLRDYFAYLMPDLDEETCVKLEEHYGEFSRNNEDIILEHISPTEHSQEVLEKIVRNEHDQILISNVTDRGLEFFIDSVGVKRFFPDGKAFAANGRNGGSKKRILTSYLDGAEIDYEQIVTIGDSPKDIELVSDLPNGVSFLYSHVGKGFRDCNPTYKIKDLRCVVREIIS